MPLTQGSVSISVTGAETKTGSAGRLYDLLKATINAAMPGGIQNDEQGIRIKSALADQANDFSEWLHVELTQHAQAKIATTASGLQRIPVVFTDTEGPTATKFLPIE